MARPTIVFDVNETLLDLSALDPLFADGFGDKGARRVWFMQTLQNALTSTIVGTYEPFDRIARAALEMTARKRGVRLDDERINRIMRAFAAMPAHGDAVPALSRLRESGYRLAVLAQSPEALLEEQLRHAKLRDFFDEVLSVESVRRFKPAREAYDFARERLDCGEDAPWLVAAHEWDVLGALSAGWNAAFVARHGTALNPLEREPTLVAPDLRALVDALAERIAA